MCYLKFNFERNNSGISDKELLEFYKEKFDKIHNLNGMIQYEDKMPVLSYRFDTPQKIEEIFSRNLEFFNKFHQLQQKGVIPKDAFVKKIGEVGDQQKNTPDIILKEKTSHTVPIKQNYNFVFPLLEFMQLGTGFEEIENGFLIFYQNLELFRHMQVDRLDFSKMRKWLENLNLWNKNTENLLKYLLNQAEY